MGGKGDHKTQKERSFLFDDIAISLQQEEDNGASPAVVIVAVLLRLG
jgi:hypothetical protein